MAEVPEAETVARDLATVVGRTIKGTAVLVPDVLRFGMLASAGQSQ